MTRVRRVRPPAAGARPAFTLVELMVVLAIIGVLAALVAAAVTKVIPAQQQRNTERTIQKMNGELQSHWRAVIDDARDEFKRNPNLLPTTLTGGDPERGKVLWTKLRLVQQFPMSYQELLFPATVGGVTYLSADPTYKAKLTAAGILNPPPSPSLSVSVGKIYPGREELATCLYIALTAKSHRGKTTQEDSFNADERRTNSTNGLPMIVDNWNQPLVYFRWPANDQAFQLTKPSTSAFGDPLDPTGRLMDPTWNAANALTVEAAIKHPIRNAAGLPFSYYMLPVIVSAGQDGDLGINDYVAGINSGYFMTPINPGAAADNIYSYLLK